MLSPELTHLHTHLSAAMKSVPGARQLIAFGSNRNGVPDEFSDMDLQLLVDDCETALPAFLSVLGEEIAPEIEWTFSDDPNHYWLMALPDAARPWMKVDLGLDPYLDGQPDDLGWTGEVEWTQPAPVNSITAVSEPTWPRPARGTLEHFVLWHLIDLGQLAKYHHRHQPLGTLKYIAQLNQALVVAEAFRQGQEVDLSTTPFVDLDVSSTTVKDMDQTAFAELGDVNVPLVDHILRLAAGLRDASGADEPTTRAFERMIHGSDAVLRGTGPSDNR